MTFSATISFANSTFDMVDAGEIIEHLFDTRRFMSEIGRVVKAGAGI